MPRALWNGAISFGLVHIPVELYPAVQQHSLGLNLLDRRDLGPIGYRKINKLSGAEVSNEDIVKGYEYEKGRYVVLGEEDFRLANVKATQTVDIQSFIAGNEIPARYFDTPYYLAPGKRGEKVYALLRETMLRARRVALATVVIQQRQHLAVVMAEQHMLVLNTLRYHDEIRATEGLKLPQPGAQTNGINDAEIDMALKLIENMSGRWQPENYRDSYREDLMARIENKISRGETGAAPEGEEAPPEPQRKGELIDLMALLRDSLRTKPAAAAKQEAKQAVEKPAAERPGARKRASSTTSTTAAKPRSKQRA